MMDVTLYDSEGVFGKILSGDSEFIANNTKGLDYLDGIHSRETHFFDGSGSAQRTQLNLKSSPSSIIADNDDTAIVADIPPGVFITWPDGLRQEVTDGAVEFSSLYAGRYKLIFDGPRYLPQEITIEATIPAA